MDGVAKVAFSGHWLTFTAGFNLARVMKEVGGGWSQGERSGAFEHSTRRVHESGATVHYGSLREDQPIVVNASGEVCETWFDHLVQAACRLPSLTTRLDLAADVDPPELARRRILELRRSFKRKLVQTRMRASRLAINEDPKRPGYTWYLGSKSSSLMLRAYDEREKLRLEWQYRPVGRMKALVVPAVKSQGVAACWRMCAVNAVFPMPWYQALLDGERCEAAEEKEALTTLAELKEALRIQYGGTFHVLSLLGESLDSLSVPPEKPRGFQIAKWSRYADEAEAAGRDVSQLRRELERWRRFKSGR